MSILLFLISTCLAADCENLQDCFSCSESGGLCAWTNSKCESTGAIKKFQDPWFTYFDKCFDERGFCKTNYNVKVETSVQKSQIQSVEKKQDQTFTFQMIQPE